MTISIEEWNELSNQEQEKRCKEFVQFVETGVPAGLSDLAHYAETFRTPVPSFTLEKGIDFGNYNMGTAK